MRWRFFRRKKRELLSLTPQEEELLIRELQESQKSPMDDNPQSNLNGGTLTSIKFLSTINGSGPDAVVARRFSEPRQGWNPEDKDQI